ncbi:semaphorin-6A-like [Elgaria multicarinata webbii]|uniref:semaphorin-6A-like n=1 Tax=Elgaria multicarinata webbii TaxID=159646 RepID=UPI002FCCE397
MANVNHYPAFVGKGPGKSPSRKDTLDIQLLMTSDRTLYVGARNHVFAINLDQSYEDEIQFSKSITWEPTAAAKEDCRVYGRQQTECQNFIKVILKRKNDKLFICGTNAFNPLCRHYKMDTLAPQGDISSGKGRCPYDPKDSNVALFADDNLYSATASDFKKRDSLIYRSLGDSPRLRTYKQNSKWLKEPSFIHAVDYQSYIYFFFEEESVEYAGVDKVMLPRVARVCKNDMGGNAAFLENEWTSFLKARLICSVPGDSPFHFNMLRSVSDVVKLHGQDVVIAVFNTPKNSIPGSAVCAFSIQDIEKVFAGRFKEQKSPTSIWTPVPDAMVPQTRPGSCAGSELLKHYKSSHDFPDDTLEFMKEHSLMDGSVGAVSLQPLFLQTRISDRILKITVDNKAGPKGDQTVVFLGSENGWLLKILVLQGSPVFLEEMDIYNYKKCAPDFGIAETNIVDLKVDKPSETLYVAFQNCVRRVPLGSCERHGPCKKACIASRDPYCGWANEACIHLSPGTTVEYEQDIENGKTDGLDDC